MAESGDARNAAFELEKALGAIVGKLQLRLWQVLTAESPVDLGFFRSRWTPIVGAGLPGGEKPPRDRRRAQSEARTKQETNRRRALQISKTYQIKQGRVTISNPTIYGPRLAAGSSSQASSGWVERAIVKAARSVARTPPIR